MLCRIAVLAVLLGFSAHALADFELIKVDLNQVAFDQLMVKGGSGVTGGGGSKLVGKGPGIKGNNNPLIGVDDSVWIYGFFEVRGKAKQFTPGEKGSTTFRKIDHSRWGLTTSFYSPELANIQFSYLKRVPLQEEFSARNGMARSADDFIRLANWALTHGMTRQFDMTMSTNAKKFAERAAFMSCSQLKAEMKKPATAEAPHLGPLTGELKGDGYSALDSPEGHYRVYYKKPPDFTPANLSNLKWRLGRMEEAYSNYFYWIALQEKMPVPALPAYRLTVIVDNPLDFSKRLKESAATTAPGDGFLLRKQNVVVLTTKPTDDLFQYLDRNLSPVRDRLRLPIDELVTGTGQGNRRLWDREDVKNNLLNVSMIQTLTLLQQIMQDEAETRAIQQECTRQLLGATGILSRNVAAPEWIQRGLVSFFETPPASLHPNFGLVRGNYLATLKNLRKTFKPATSGEESGAILLNLVSDNYYRRAQKELRDFRDLEKKDIDPRERRRLQKSAKESHDVAAAASWALVYYLAVQRKIDYLSRYADKLNQLPRKTPITPATFEACFAQAFDLADAKNPARLDQNKLQTFAEAWLDYMANNVFVDDPGLEAFMESPAVPAK